MFALDYGQYFDCFSGPEFQPNKNTNFEVKPRAIYIYNIFHLRVRSYIQGKQIKFLVYRLLLTLLFENRYFEPNNRLFSEKFAGPCTL